MTSYAYEAVDLAGLKIAGTLDVPSQSEALRRIKDMGLFPVRVAERSQVRRAQAAARPGALARLRTFSFAKQVFAPRVKPSAVCGLSRRSNGPAIAQSCGNRSTVQVASVNAGCSAPVASPRWNFQSSLKLLCRASTFCSGDAAAIAMAASHKTGASNTNRVAWTVWFIMGYRPLFHRSVEDTSVAL